MANALSNLTLSQLKRAVEIKERVEALESELGHILRGSAGTVENGAPRQGRRGRGMGAAARARIAAAQRARWARQREATVEPEAAPQTRRKRRRKMSPAGRARLVAAAKARWARARAAGKTSL